MGTGNATDTLMLALAEGPVSAVGDIAWFNARMPGRTIPDDLAGRLVAEQPWRGPFVALDQRLRKVPHLDIADGECVAALVLCGKHRRENEAMLSRAVRAVAPGGTVILGGDGRSGAKALRKRLAGTIEMAGSLSKHHATAFWFAGGDASAMAACPPPFRSAPMNAMTADGGMFSADAPDDGSVFLVEVIAGTLRGHVADFGCGWGFLGAHVLECSAVTALTLFDAHYPSVQAARANLETRRNGRPLEAIWLDLETETVPRKFDMIVMNPPFHEGVETRRSLGEAFIHRASSALKPGGTLWMIANRSLNYGPALDAGFSSWVEVAVNNRFRICRARR